MPTLLDKPSTKNIAHHKPNIRGPLSQSTHVPRKPICPVRDEHANRESIAQQVAFAIRAEFRRASETRIAIAAHLQFLIIQ